MALRIFIAGLSHETNSFSPLPTSLQSFEADVCYRPGANGGQGRDAALGFPGYGDAVRVVREGGDEAIEGPCFWTQPSGPMARALYESLRGEILAALDAAGPIDAVILNLHGAMMAQGLDDCEGDLLAAVRDKVGDQVPVGTVLDLHGNVSARMVESGAILIGVKQYPHIDYPERTLELHAILSDMARNATRPRTLMRTIPLLGLHGTTQGPMRDLVSRLQDLEKREGIMSATLMHGFLWSDGPDTGACVLIIHDQAAPDDVAALAHSLAGDFQVAAIAAASRRPGVHEAVRQALAIPAETHEGPVVIADSSDNPGGGAACDSTFLLEELVAQRVQNAAIGMIWDPQAARIAADAGVGARLPLRVGGKVGPMSGNPVDIEAEVLCVRDDAKQCVLGTVPTDPLGLAVALRAGGIDIVVNSHRQQVFSTECFTELGIDLAAKSLVVVKSTQHFRARFDPVASATLYCDAPGTLSLDLSGFVYRAIDPKSHEGVFVTDVPVRIVTA